MHARAGLYTMQITPKWNYITEPGLRAFGYRAARIVRLAP
jgi:hypothetical protein